MTSILLAEDEALLCEAYTLLLETHGYEVTAVANGKDAFDVCCTENLDLILLDIMMPEMDGVEFLEAVKKEKLSLPPVIVLSNLSMGSELDKVHKLGAAHSAVKSDLTPSQIVALVQRWSGGTKTISSHIDE